jgi:hypothetical protein
VSIHGPSGSNSAVVAGFNSTASGNGSFASGSRATTRALDYSQAHAAGRFAADGDAQSCRFVHYRQTTTATATALSAGGAAPAAATAIVLPDSSVYHFIARIAARNNANGHAGAYEIRGAIKRGSGVATTAILGTPAVTTVGADSGASAWAVAAVANTTLGSLEIQVTGAASTTIKWVASVWTTEVVG